MLRPLLLYKLTQLAKEPSNLNEVRNLNQASVDEETTERCWRQCLNTAYRMIEIIRASLQDPYRSTGWHTLQGK